MRLAAAKGCRDAETPKARETRLAARRATDRARRDVCRERARAQSRRAQETPADRDHCLAAERDRSQSRRAQETPADRDHRLAAERDRSQSRRAQETPVERDHHLSADRGRSQSRRDRAREDQHSEESRCTNPSRMVEFHESNSSLTSSTCETCLEQFPNMSVSRQPNGVNECHKCATDKHIPKLYSSGNNMNPGPLPPQLQVLLFK